MPAEVKLRLVSHKRTTFLSEYGPGKSIFCKPSMLDLASGKLLLSEGEKTIATLLCNRQSMRLRVIIKSCHHL